MPSPARHPKPGLRSCCAQVRARALLLAAAGPLLLVLGCSRPVSQSGDNSPTPIPRTDAVAPAYGLTVPGTYATGFGCADVPKTDILLTLYPESLFVLRQTYRDRACEQGISLVYLGEWRVAGDSRMLTLLGALPRPRRFVIVDHRTLRMMDGPVPRAGSVPTAEIGRTARLVPFREPFRLRGIRPSNRVEGL
jgi:NlpE N-terminal domain